VELSLYCFPYEGVPVPGHSQDAGGVQQHTLSHGHMLACYSETLVSAHRTQCDNPEDNSFKTYDSYSY
jgi:hypothetical protein